MWFKNAQLFQFIGTCELNAEQLEQDLIFHGFKPCLSTAHSSMGWTAPTGEEDTPLVHAANGFLLICLKLEDKILPASVINEMLADKIAAIEAQTGRKPGKRERANMREDLVHSLLPRAFSKSTYLYAYIDTQQGWLVLNSPSANKADVFIDYLRKSIGSLKIQLPEIQPVSLLLTDWVMTNEYPADFSIDDTCVLTDNADGGTIRCQRQDLMSQEIKGLLETGREIAQLTLTWRDQVRFTLTNELVIKSIKFLEIIQDQAKDIFTETAQQQFDATFTLMTETLRQLVEQLISIFGKSAENTHPTIETEAPAPEAEAAQPETPAPSETNV